MGFSRLSCVGQVTTLVAHASMAGALQVDVYEPSCKWLGYKGGWAVGTIGHLETREFER